MSFLTMPVPPVFSAKIPSVEYYRLDQSPLYDVQAMDQFGEGMDSLPEALRPTPSKPFRTHANNIGPKFGVRDYQRQIEKLFCDHADMERGILFTTMRKRSPTRDAIKLLQLQGVKHSYDIVVRRRKSAGRDHIYIRTTFPRPHVCGVLTGEDQHYEDTFTRLIQMEYFLTPGRYEYLHSALPFGFTTHALERLWERCSLDGTNFHLAVSEAMMRCRGVISLIILAHGTLRQEIPAHLAIPCLGGLVIASVRRTYSPPESQREGCRWSGGRCERLDPDDLVSNLEYLANATNPVLLHTNVYFGATYMGATDIGSRDRVRAADEFGRWLTGRDLTTYARHMEHFTRTAFSNDPAGLIVSHDEAEQIKAWQARMLPRSDPFDSRAVLFI